MSKLDKYIGLDYNQTTKTEIEQEFEPYTVMVCDLTTFYEENYWENIIRCVVENGQIYKLQFN